DPAYSLATLKRKGNRRVNSSTRSVKIQVLWIVFALCVWCSFSLGSQGLPDNPVSKEVLRRLRENLRADPTDLNAKAELVYVLNSVASLEIAKGDLVAARNSLDEALRLDKRNPMLLSNLAMIDLRLGNYPAA